jgi:Raf kinase inhibitor-like YbhB/YbcL family protein
MRLISARYVAIQVMGFFVFFGLPAFSEADLSVFTLTSSDFQNGARIPERYTCSGGNQSPALEWGHLPGRTRSLALIVDDPDAPLGTFVHWVVYNIAPTMKGMPEGAAPSGAENGGEQGVNGRGEIGYTGPCPPSGKPHHYHFRLYALDQDLELKPGATSQQVEDLMKGHILSATELVGIFER